MDDNVVRLCVQGRKIEPGMNAQLYTLRDATRPPTGGWTCRAQAVRRDHFVRLIANLESDDEALIVLKGHLVIEERITAAIEKFVLHLEHLDAACLTFAQIGVRQLRQPEIQQLRPTLRHQHVVWSQNRDAEFRAYAPPPAPPGLHGLDGMVVRHHTQADRRRRRQNQ